MGKMKLSEVEELARFVGKLFGADDNLIEGAINNVLEDCSDIIEDDKKHDCSDELKNEKNHINKKYDSEFDKNKCFYNDFPYIEEFTTEHPLNDKNASLQVSPPEHSDSKDDTQVNVSKNNYSEDIHYCDKYKYAIVNEYAGNIQLNDHETIQFMYNTDNGVCPGITDNQLVKILKHRLPNNKRAQELLDELIEITAF